MTIDGWTTTSVQGVGQILLSPWGAKSCLAESPEAIVEILRALASRNEDWQITTQPDPHGQNSLLQIDVSAMDRVLRLDPVGGYMQVQSGALMKTIEDAANGEGFTIGPIPKHLEEKPLYQVLAHQFVVRPSPRYGSFRDGILAVQAALVDGLTACALAPRRAMGPDLLRCLLAGPTSPGILTDCHIHVWPLPTHEMGLKIAAPSRHDALRLMQVIRQDGIRPSAWCAYPETSEWRLEIQLAETYELDDIRGRIEAHAQPLRVLEAESTLVGTENSTYSWTAQANASRASVADVRPGEILVESSVCPSSNTGDRWAAYYDVYTTALALRDRGVEP